MTFGAYLRKLRIAKQMSQVALAAQLGVSRSYTCHMENDRSEASVHLIMKIACVLGGDIHKMLVLAGKLPKQVKVATRDNRLLLEILLRLNEQQFSDGVYRSILRFLRAQEESAS